MNIALWIVQVLLGVMFTFAGFTKLTTPIADLVSNMNMVWAGDMPAALVRFIGASEVLGGIGLILPAATRIKPILTPLAAIGLATIMILALGFHIMRGEIMPPVVINSVLAGLAAFIAWGRLKKAPIVPRT